VRPGTLHGPTETHRERIRQVREALGGT
jgi:hypothetical protein